MNLEGRKTNTPPPQLQLYLFFSNRQGDDFYPKVAKGC